MKSYKIVRLNPEIGTVTTLLEYNDKTLQQDVPVDNFTDKEAIHETILPFLDKLQEDIEAVEIPTVAATVQELVDQTIEVE